MFKVELSDLAVQDLVEIENYTARIWGDKQSDKYLSELEQRFYWLAEYEGVGKLRDEIAKGLFSFPEGRHVIFYRINGSVLDVARILHQSMDIEYHL